MGTCDIFSSQSANVFEITLYHHSPFSIEHSNFSISTIIPVGMHYSKKKLIVHIYKHTGEGIILECN